MGLTSPWRVRRVGALMAALVVAGPVAANPDSGPIAPCGPNSAAPYPAFAEAPNVRNWRAGDIPAGWAPAACIGWASQRFTVLTALAGRFRFRGGIDDLVARFGAQSAWRGIRYWSVLDKTWNTLITDASALTGGRDGQRRPDFSVAEMKSGAELYFLQQDNRSSNPVVYRMRVTEAEPTRMVVTMENVTAVSLLLFTLFGPGDLQSTYVFEQLAPDTWGYYSLSGARESYAVIGDQDASYVNRAAAIYRHLIGIPGDQGPPLAR
jgi:hypothetical protein